MLSAISEPVVGAAVVRTHAIEERTQDRIDDSIDALPAGQHQGAGPDRVLVLARRAVLGPGQRRGDRDRHPARPRRRHHLRQGAGLRLPGHAVRRAGADRHPGAHRRPERDRRLAAHDRHPGHPGRPGRPRARRARPAGRGAGDRLPRRAVRLPGRPAGARRRHRAHRARHPGRRRGRDRLGQDHLRQAAHPADGRLVGRGRAGRHRRAPDRLRHPAPSSGDGAAGGLPVRLHAARQRPLRPPRRRSRRRPSSRGRAGSRRLARRAARRDWRPGSASAGSR